MSIIDKRSEPFAKPSRTGKQIDDAERGGQIGLLTNFGLTVYTRFEREDQGTCD